MTGVSADKSSLSGTQICVVDDDELFRGYVAALLADHGIATVEAADGRELARLLSAKTVDCIVLDFALASENGLAVQDELRGRIRDFPPVIMLTADDSHKTIIKAFRTGVCDYLVKQGLRAEELVAAIRRAIERRAAETEFQQEVARLKRQSEFDEMTGLYRREAMEDRLARVATSALRTRARFAVLLIAIAEYDIACARFGQVIGDRLLRSFAARLRGCIRQIDVCGRFDNDTFIYLIDLDISPEDLQQLTERLRQALTFEVRLDALSLTLSPQFGVAHAPASGTRPSDLLASARAELGAAKRLVGAPGAAGAASAAEIAQPDLGDCGPPLVRDSDRREQRRQRILRPGKIVINELQSVIDCTVRDLSQRGARLRMEDSFFIPAQFELLVVGSGTPRRAQRRWQKGKELGVEFLT